METLSCKIASIEEDPSFAVEDVEFADTSRQRYLGTDTPVFTWDITTTVMNAAGMQTLRNFYLARKGAYESFSWTDPRTGSAYTVTFVAKSFKISNVDANTYKASFSLRTN